MHADGRAGEGIDHVVHMVPRRMPGRRRRATVRSRRLARPAGDRALAHLARATANAPHGLAVVMEAGALPGQPAQQPHLVIVRQLQPLEPALSGR